MQTIFLYQFQLQSPQPPILGWLLWKLPQPNSSKDKDGVRECKIMEASATDRKKQKNQWFIIDTQSPVIPLINFTIFICQCGLVHEPKQSFFS